MTGSRRWFTVEAKSFEEETVFYHREKQGWNIVDSVRRGEFGHIVEGGQ